MANINLCRIGRRLKKARVAKHLTGDIKKLPKAEREKFFKMLDVYFGRD